MEENVTSSASATFKAEKVFSPKLAYSPEEAAVAVDVGRSTMYEVLGTGDLPSRKVGRRTLILHDDLMAWLASLPVREIEAA